MWILLFLRQAFLAGLFCHLIGNQSFYFLKWFCRGVFVKSVKYDSIMKPRKLRYSMFLCIYLQQTFAVAKRNVYKSNKWYTNPATTLHLTTKDKVMKSKNSVINVGRGITQYECNAGKTRSADPHAISGAEVRDCHKG